MWKHSVFLHHFVSKFTDSILAVWSCSKKELVIRSGGWSRLAVQQHCGGSREKRSEHK